MGPGFYFSPASTDMTYEQAELISAVETAVNGRTMREDMCPALFARGLWLTCNSILVSSQQRRGNSAFWLNSLLERPNED